MMMIEFLEGFTVTLPAEHISIALYESTKVEFEASLMVDGMKVPVNIERNTFCANIPRSEGP